MSGRRSGSGWSRDLALSELDEKKKALENSRQHLQNEIDLIDYNLKKIQAEYGMICNESSLFLNLPTEVLCVILDLAASAHRLEEPWEKSLLPEVVMSHVCKHLRGVALDYPALWTRFYFFLDNVRSGMSNTLTRFDTYVKRSRSQNLELFLDFTENVAGLPPPEERVKLLNRAIKHINRWKIVTLLSNCDLNVEELFPTLMVASAPNLEYLSYSPLSPDVQNSDVLIQCLKPGLLQGGTPKLRYLLLDSTSLRMPAFDTVTTLRIEAGFPGTGCSYSWESFLTMLSLPLLTNLSIAGDIVMGPTSNQFPIVTMNNLKHLRYSDNGFMTPMLPFLRAPLLETLLIHRDDELDDDESEIENIDTSYFFPSLQSLTITYTSFISGDSAWRIMQLSKNIDQLTIFKTDNFFKAVMTHSHSIAECWPRLSGVTANWSPPDSDVLQSLSRFILSRLSIIPPKLWFLKELDDYYKSAFPATYRGIKERCAVELLKDETEMLLLQPSWPPGVDSPDYALRDDPFFKKILY